AGARIADRCRIRAKPGSSSRGQPHTVERADLGEPDFDKSEPIFGGASEICAKRHRDRKGAGNWPARHTACVEVIHRKNRTRIMITPKPPTAPPSATSTLPIATRDGPEGARQT